VAVLGNHDTEHDAIRRSFAGAGIPLLENKAVKIARGGHDFWIAGLADQVPFGNRPMADLDATLAQVSDSRPVILLAHEPEIFPRVPPRVALTLSGHTHGGQVWLPFIGPPTMRGERYVYGEYIENGRHLVVSGGLGVTVAPVRFMVPPEITVVTVRSA
jgi:predicted MPP superfamily phosphohydrolase